MRLFGLRQEYVSLLPEVFGTVERAGGTEVAIHKLFTNSGKADDKETRPLAQTICRRVSARRHRHSDSGYLQKRGIALTSSWEHTTIKGTLEGCLPMRILGFRLCLQSPSQRVVQRENFDGYGFSGGGQPSHAANAAAAV